MNKEEAYQSFKNAEKLIERDVKSGLLNERQARNILNQARKNYKNMSYAKFLDRKDK